MSSISQFESIINPFNEEINKIAADLNILFNTSSSLLTRLERKLKEFNELFGRTISTNFTKNEFHEIIAANPDLRASIQTIFDDEVKLRMKIHSILALTSNQSFDDNGLVDTNQDFGSGNDNDNGDYLNDVSTTSNIN